jgi:heat shock protein HslJ
MFMKKNLFFYGSIVLVIGIMSCKFQQSETNANTDNATEMLNAVDHSKNSLDWAGTYTGVIPCADCSGIQTTIELTENETYKLVQTYLDKEDGHFDSSGKFTWNQEGNTVTLGKGDDMMQFQVGEGMLIMLDREGNEITGDLAENYILAKIDINLVEKYWKLTELFGEPVITPEGGKEAHMILKAEGNLVNGNSGCNTFNGSYTLKPGNRIRFSQMVSTMMMCLNMETEKKMSEVLEMTDNYVLNGDTLILNKARMAPLARFEAVSLK